MGELWENLYNTHLFYATRYKLVHWRIQQADATPHEAHSYIQTQHRERGNVGVLRENSRRQGD